MKARGLILLVLAASLAVAPGAQAGWRLTLVISNRVPAVGETVRAVLRTEPAQAHCRLRLVAVRPSVDTRRALDVLAVRPQRSYGFFVPLARKNAKEWRATVRFGRTGPWKLVVPNWCADGYVLPPPIVQVVTVRSR